MGVNAANVLVEGQFQGCGSRFGNCQAGAQDGIGAQIGFIGRAIQLEQNAVN